MSKRIRSFQSRIAALLVSGCVSLPALASSPGLELPATAHEQPFTIGYVFRAGEFQRGSSLQAVSANGARIPLQVDDKAFHRDGSIRHAILSGFTPAKLKNATRFDIIPADREPEGVDISLDQLIKAGVTADIRLHTQAKTYSLSLQSLLAGATESVHQQSLISRLLGPSATSGGVIPQQWLAGPVVSEWIVGGPLLGGNGHPHDHLAGYFHVRIYRDLRSTRIDMVIENNRTFQKQPHNIRYDVELLINGKPVYAKKDLNHFHHARWHKSFWVDDKPAAVAVHDIDYLQSTGAVPRYMPLRPTRVALSNLLTAVEPMSNGPLPVYMGATGASPAIGPLPRWAAMYVVSGDPVAQQATLAGGDAGGAYSIHYRDENTGLPVSIDQYPRLSINGGSLSNGPDKSQFSHDQAHQPSIAYLPYLISGDYFYLEELQFWANWNMLWSHHEYRNFEKGIIGSQVRGQAWALREIGRAAYLTPDDHPLKKYFNDRILFNIDYNTQLYPNNPVANKLGALKSYDGFDKFAPWMDDFYTWTMGHLVELGFDEAKEMRDWKAGFPVQRMSDGNNGYCYVLAAPYRLVVGPGKNQWWPDFAVLYRSNFPDKLSKPCPDGQGMSGHAESPTGYPSNLRPALAIAVDAGIPGAVDAWKRFVSSAVQPDYNDYPNFALQPRVPIMQEKKR